MSARPGRSIIYLLLGACAAVPARAGDAVPVTFVTSDDLVIAADYYAPRPTAVRAPMVILLHMYRSDRAAWKPLTKPLHEAGFAVLAIDMRGHGESATERTRRAVNQRRTAVFEAMPSDVRSAYDWLAGQQGVDRSRFALVGASVGCSVSLRYAAEDRSVDAIVCLSPGVDYLGLDSRIDIRKLKGRQLWLLATDDARERRGVEVLAPLTEGTRSTLFPGRHHGTRMFGQIPGLEQRVTDFLKESVGEPTETTVYASIAQDVYHLPGSEWIERISPTDLRYYSSPKEAESRGLREAKSRGPTDQPRKKPGG